MHQRYQINGKGSADSSEVGASLQDFRIKSLILQIWNNFYVTLPSLALPTRFR